MAQSNISNFTVLPHAVEGTEKSPKKLFSFTPVMLQIGSMFLSVSVTSAATS